MIQDSKTPIQVLTNGLFCPKCSSNAIIKNGYKNKNQQYICKKCRRSFGAAVGTALHHIHKKEQFNAYTQCLHTGMSIRAAAKHIGISIATSFAWRHKHLSAQKQIGITSLNKLKTLGIDTRAYSRKGQKNQNSDKNNLKDKSLITTDSNNRTIILKYNNGFHLKQLLLKITESNSSIAIEDSYTLPRICKNINLHKGRKMQKHLSPINTIKTELDQWISTFKGVSSKYLQHYWTWYSIFRNQTPDKEYLQQSLCNTQAARSYKFIKSQ